MSKRDEDGVLRVERVARKRHHCDWDCEQPIEPGTRYVRWSLPPGSDLGNTGWWSLAGHGHSLHDCPRYRTNDTATTTERT